MTHTIIGIGLSILLVGIFILSLWGLSRESGKVYDGLDMLWNKAKAAKTRADLLVVRSELCRFANKKCVFRAYGDYARRVLSYIDGKLSGMS